MLTYRQDGEKWRNTMENKFAIVKALEGMVKLTRAGADIDTITLDTDVRYAYIKYNNGYCTRVCVECDSGASLIRDIMAKIN